MKMLEALTEQEKKIMKDSIETYKNAETVPTNFFAAAQPATTKLWMIIRAADRAGVLAEIEKELGL